MSFFQFISSFVSGAGTEDLLARAQNFTVGELLPAKINFVMNAFNNSEAIAKVTIGPDIWCLAGYQVHYPDGRILQCANSTDPDYYNVCFSIRIFSLDPDFYHRESQIRIWILSQYLDPDPIPISGSGSYHNTWIRILSQYPDLEPITYLDPDPITIPVSGSYHIT